MTKTSTIGFVGSDANGAMSFTYPAGSDVYDLVVNLNASVTAQEFRAEFTGADVNGPRINKLIATGTRSTEQLWNLTGGVDGGGVVLVEVGHRVRELLRHRGRALVLGPQPLDVRRPALVQPDVLPVRRTHRVSEPLVPEFVHHRVVFDFTPIKQGLQGYVYWDKEQKKWVGSDVPDFPPLTRREIVARVLVDEGQHVRAGQLLASLDFGVVTFVPSEKGLKTVVLASDELVVLSHPKHPFAKMSRVTLEEFGRATVIAHSDPSPARDRVLRSFEQRHLPLDIHISLPSLDAIKRAFDISVSAIVLLLLSPLFGLIALAVWVEDGGPVFFAQTRQVPSLPTMQAPTGLAGVHALRNNGH